MKSLLVVCEGNICRSPMAQALLSEALPEITVISAGLGALVGKPADDMAVMVMRSMGVDIRSHRAVQINRSLCVGADLIFVMERQQRRNLEELYPEVRGRVFGITEHLNLDVPDPYGGPQQEFRDALALIRQGVEYWLQRLRRL